MSKRISKAIFPVAGMGTRFLPATKAIPKEILPLVDRPLIQYAIDEAREAGIEEFIFVTARGKSALEDYFDAAPELERSLIAKKKTALLDILNSTNMDSGAIAYVRQKEALGLGHAVWCARRLIADEPVAVLLPDDVMVGGKRPCLAQMVEAWEKTDGNGTMVATMEVDDAMISSYGVIDPDLTATDISGRTVRAKGLVEKPKAEDAPSNLAVIGRYILPPTIFDYLSEQKTGAGGEIQLTDAIAAEAAAGRAVHGFRFEGQRFDCGSKAGYLQATVSIALQREDLAEELAEFLGELQPRIAMAAE
ncbi:UTP--glucose-1-phosphate uridylyltransferase [Paroceanicella profunda]|uniref:UTP--glucose-1-phosphate uridylyltransferase n=1 Tax=Paroceanicella profunda TaxID=2579971 RepID=A0A5B8FYW4_9RHOB|nr:UTP--glucose-1-phosphate uridylyltransferase [Paroceanicella profunda]QDL91782.1 UTP--glucose-1-phosphate uridylyltransferase [Paroceanicella profunda]